MGDHKELSPAEEARCLAALHLFGVHSPDHPVLRHRGYFVLYLSGLNPSEVEDEKGLHPSVQEFRELQRLLARAGVERLRELLVSPPGGDGQTPGSGAPSPVSEEPIKEAPHLVSDEAPRSRFSGSRGIEPLRPTPEARERRKQLPHPEAIEETLRLARGFLERGFYHDAYSICADYLATHGIDEIVLEKATRVIRTASQYDRAKGRAPFNMLFECEEMAHLLARFIPDMTALSDHADEHTVKMFRCVKMVYETWTDNARALLEYRFKTASETYIQRQWIEPRDVGFLLDIMSTGVRSKLPLDLLRVIYVGARKCIEVAQHAIAFEQKKAKFEGDALRIVASPVKGLAPDMQLEIYRDIVRAYLREGDTHSAKTFVDQALLIRKHDRELLDLQEQVRHLIAKGHRQGERRSVRGLDTT